MDGDLTPPLLHSARGAALSVLDLAPVPEGCTAGEALARSTELARHAEALGYHRVWVAEHHNMPGIASSAPAVLLAHLGAHTSRIRLGAGGVMLPNHAPLTVAEQFGMLEALHPGRIDLGIGRAPGTDPVTAAALRRGLATEDFPAMLRDLLAYFDGDHPQITAVPGAGHRPRLYMLGSSDYGAQVAGLLGIGFCFAHHFAAPGTMAALAAYRAAYRPSRFGEQPYVMLGVPVICADTTARAEELARPSAISFLSLRRGRPRQLLSVADAAVTRFDPLEEQVLSQWRAPLICGDPVTVAAGLDDLVARTGADELFVTTMVPEHAARLRSYELLATIATGRDPRSAYEGPINTAARPISSAIITAATA